MSKKLTKAARASRGEAIVDLLQRVNKLREERGVPPVKLEWTGLCHWLSTPAPSQPRTRLESATHSVGGLFESEEQLMSFLEGYICACETHAGTNAVAGSAGT